MAASFAVVYGVSGLFDRCRHILGSVGEKYSNQILSKIVTALDLLTADGMVFVVTGEGRYPINESTNHLQTAVATLLRLSTGSTCHNYSSIAAHELLQLSA